MMHLDSKYLRFGAMCQRGFSLIEVVVAVGIFAIAIVSVIGLLGPINKSVADVRDFDDASRVVAAIQGKLQEAGFDSVKGVLNDSTVTLYASRDGNKVGTPDTLDADGASIWEDNNVDKFFAIDLVRNIDLSKAANDETAGYLAFTITLRWPAYTPDGQPFTNASQQSVMVIPAAITR